MKELKFEKENRESIRKGLKNSFPESTLLGCFFHFLDEGHKIRSTNFELSERNEDCGLLYENSDPYSSRKKK